MSRSNSSDLSCINASPWDNANVPQLQKISLLDHKNLKESIFNAMAWVSFPTHLSDVDWPMAISLLFVSCAIYLIVVRRLRFRGIRQLEKRYGATPEKFKHIDYKDAQNILANLFLLDAPWLFLTAKDFAFLRVSEFTHNICSTA